MIRYLVLVAFEEVDSLHRVIDDVPGRGEPSCGDTLKWGSDGYK